MEAIVGSRMIVFVLTGNAPLVLQVLLALLVYLTWIEVRAEPMSAAVRLWWCLLVLLVNLPGYIVLRVWLLVSRRRAT